MEFDNPDFVGWATRNDVVCSDHRVIRRDAFAHNDGKVVPVIWGHEHHRPDYVLGKALLKNEPEGVRAYGLFNDTVMGRTSKSLVEHGDIVSISICANQLKHDGNSVIYGDIKEVSLVVAGANPKALIDTVNIKHSDGSGEDAVIYFGQPLELNHSEDIDSEEDDVELDDTESEEDDTDDNDPIEDEESDDEIEHSESMKGDDKVTEKEKTIGDIIATMNDEQKEAMYATIAILTKNEGESEVMHNIFENNDVVENNEDVLTHEAQMEIIGDAKRYGSMRESALQHGVNNLEYLFPDERTVTNEPILITRDMSWVRYFMSAVHKTPFSRIKSLFADITEDDARARGYIKGKMKKEEVFSLLKRSTSPTTVYKKQKIDRDDAIDIVDMDVVSWIKREMRTMLDEEIARAALIGDGRLASSDDKIDENCIRPIWTDAELFTIKARFDADTTANAADVNAKNFIRAAIKSRKDYKGSGNPTCFTTEDILTDCLLLTDNMGRDLYETPEKLAKKMRVKDIVTVPAMEGCNRSDGGNTYDLMGLIVNLADYNIGADKGGAVNMFDDFDIDYNAMKYLIETRCSGALTKPFSAIAIESKRAGG